MKILLIRHGEAEEEGGDSSLTSQGIEQAKQVAEVLKNYSIDKIYVSKLARAKQTYNEFAKLTKYVAEETEELNEIYRVIIGGPVREGTLKNRAKNDKKRADTFYKKLMGQNKEVVVVFAHGNIIRYFLSKVLFLKKVNLWDKLILDPGSISIIEKDDSNVKVKAVNMIDHIKKNNLTRKNYYLN